ncbi:14218_t:CDS:2, partial [Funneliformis caledonium]
SEPLFPPLLWSVTDNIEYSFPRTQNNVEVWHRRWEILVGRAHASRSLQRKQDHEREDRIQTVYYDHKNRELMDYLREIAHNLSF